MIITLTDGSCNTKVTQLHVSSHQQLPPAVVVVINPFQVMCHFQFFFKLLSGQCVLMV